jgi:hypothetical protein
VTVSPYSLAPCARRVARDLEREFVWSPRLATKTVAARAMALLDRRTPLEATNHALEQLAGEADQSIAPYLAALTPGARSQVVRYCVELMGALLTRRPLHPETRFNSARFRFAAGPVDLRANSDLSRGGLLGVISLGAEAAEVQLAHLGLVATLNRRTPPTAVAGFDVGAARWIRYEVSAELLVAALDRCCERVGELAGAAACFAPSAISGPACHWCDWRLECDVGRDYLDGDSIRIGGLSPERET